eukprot:1183826-Pyramimonas_sp.AAC.1
MDEVAAGLAPRTSNDDWAPKNAWEDYVAALGDRGIGYCGGRCDWFKHALVGEDDGQTYWIYLAPFVLAAAIGESATSATTA